MQRGPEQSVARAEARPGALPLEDGNLLTKRENLKGNIGSAAKEDANHGEDGQNEISHEITVVADLRSFPARHH